MKTRNIYLLTIIFALLGFTSCVEQEFDTPPHQVLPEGSVFAISDLYQIYTDSGAYSFNSDAYLYATVTGDEQSGNLYKSLYIQDETGAINLHMLSSASMILVGDSVRVVLKGLYLSDYKGVMQLDSVNPDIHLVKVANNVPRDPELVTISELLTGNYTCKLVKLENVQFAATDTLKTYADSVNKITENRNLTDCDGNSIIVRNSGYADFANAPIPSGNGTLIAIASRYVSDIQLYIRELDEVQLTGERCGNNGGTGTGTGTFDDPYDIDNAIAKSGETGKWVKGYLVGVYETLDAEGNTLTEFTPKFEGPFYTNTNVIIASDAAETDIANCVVVQLPSGSIRDNTNLNSLPANEGKEIMYYGDLTPYFGEAGLKNTTGYWLDGTGIIPEEPDGFFIEEFATSLGQFTGYSVSGAQVWEWASYGSGCAKMSGYSGGAVANEDWLVSPAIDLTSKTNVVMTLSTAANYIDGWDKMQVLVSDDYSGDVATATWTEFSGYTKPTSFTFVDSGEISLTAFEGKTIYVAFKYVSTSSAAATWEIGTVVLKEKN